MKTNENLYSISEQINNNIKNIGYDYTNKILKNSISSYLLRNINISEFVDRIEPILTEIVNLPKKLKAFWNFTIPKNYKNFN